MKSLLVAVHVAAACLVSYGQAIIETNGADTITWTGNFGPGDLARFDSAVQQTPGFKTLEIVDSRGGAASIETLIRNDVRNKELTVQVRGGCLSACANIFLSAKVHRLLPSSSSIPTYLHFHGTYSMSRHVRLRDVSDEEIEEAMSNSQHRLPRALFVRARNVELQTGGLIVFREPVLSASGYHRVFFCEGTEQRRPFDCEVLPYESAEDLGLSN